MSEDLLVEIIELYPELEKEYNSEQYKISLKMIDIMMDLGLDSKKMSEIANVDRVFYLKMESGDMSIQISEYDKVLTRLLEYRNNPK